MATFADKVMAFNRSLDFKGVLPEGIRIMNPYKQAGALKSATAFYNKYYNDNRPRQLILGINPGRFGGGITGIPFTDPKKLVEKCGINFTGPVKHEPSSAFIYDMIDVFGGPEAFYNKFYISSICPLGFTSAKSNGREVNYNYYDSSALQSAVYSFMLESIKKQFRFGLDNTTVFCFGTGKNDRFIRKFNEEHKLFGKLVALEHPRYIMQYKQKEKAKYIEKYLAAFAVISCGFGLRAPC